MSRRPLILAHRGGALEAPENSLEAFERAIRLGYDGVELDVRLTKDGVPVVVHDSRASVVAGQPPVLVGATPSSHVVALPALERVLALGWGRGVLMVEVKADGPPRADRDAGAVVARAIRRSGLANALVASFSVDVLEGAREAEPTLPNVMILDGETWSRDRRSIEAFPVDVFAADFGWLEIDEAALRWIRGRGRKLWVWTVVDLAGLHRALALGVDGIITDVPGAVRERLDEGAGKVPGG